MYMGHYFDILCKTCAGRIRKERSEVTLEIHSSNDAVFTSYAVEKRCFASSFAHLDCKESSAFSQEE
jgi:hypothetical protein